MAAYLGLALALALCFQGTLGVLGGITCEDLKKDKCAFAVSSQGTRCILDKQFRRSGEVYSCKSSGIEVDNLKDWIESDRCIEACGVDRNSLGISSDNLLEPKFTQKICSPQCYQGCPNIVDLYVNLAAGEGVWLPKLCEAQKTRREMAEIRSSGIVASGPVYVNLVPSPMIAPEPMSENSMVPPMVAPTIAPEPMYENSMVPPMVAPTIAPEPMSENSMVPPMVAPMIAPEPMYKNSMLPPMLAPMMASEPMYEYSMVPPIMAPEPMYENSMVPPMFAPTMAPYH